MLLLKTTTIFKELKSNVVFNLVGQGRLPRDKAQTIDFHPKYHRRGNFRNKKTRSLRALRSRDYGYASRKKKGKKIEIVNARRR